MECLKTKRKGIIVLTAIFIFMYVLNYLTPMLNEDYFAAFVWPIGVPDLGILPENTPRVSSFSDILHNCKVYYLSEGGRLPGSFIVGALFWDLGKAYFEPFNAILMTLLIMEIYWLVHEGTVSFNFKPSYLIWIFFSLWAFNLSFVDACLWMSGSSNYLWMIVIVLAFLIPFTKNYYNTKSYNEDTPKMTATMFFSGVLAGWSHETTTWWLIVLLFWWLYLCNKRSTLHQWMIAGFIGLCLGYALLILAPGNFARLAAQQQTNSSVSSEVFYTFKIEEIVWIMLFQLFLWYFIIRFLYWNKNKISQAHIFAPYLNMAKAYSIIALGSSVFMFLIPASIIRPSFLNLVFLTIAAATLFRVQEITQEYVIKEKAKSFLKLIGYAYLLLTVMVCLWCNYNNWIHWNGVLAMIQQEQKNPTNSVLIIKPYDTDATVLSRFARGFHLIPMPVINGNEKDRINVNVARYYNLRGIAKR